MINAVLENTGKSVACAPGKAEASIALYNRAGEIGKVIREAALDGDAEALDAVARGLVCVADAYRCKAARTEPA